MFSRTFAYGGIAALVLGMTGCGSSPSVATEAPPAPSEPAATVPRPRTVPERPLEFQMATAEYGPLRVKEGKYESAAGMRPWSSWWYPRKETFLFRRGEGAPAPLQKYDQYLKVAKGKEGHSAEYEEKRLYNPDAPSWEGLCHAWAMASLLEPEPRKPVTRSGVTFSVGDLKALLIKTYESVEGGRQYGQRFDGLRGNVYDDIYPDQLHRVLQAELFEKRRPVIIDKDAGAAVWNTPIFEAQLSLERDANDPSVMHVTAWLSGASPWVRSFDHVGTLAVSFNYTYDLHGVPMPDGTLEVTHGEWTRESRDYHPDFVSILPDRVTRQTANREIDPMVVYEILGR